MTGKIVKGMPANLAQLPASVANEPGRGKGFKIV
jgi:hypothetical protein